MIKNLHFLRLLFFALLPFYSHSQVYFTDVLGGDFVCATINQPDDYEGKVTCTIVKKTTEKHKTAVLYIHGFNDYFFQKEMAEQYEAQNFAFYALDLRKYGRSYLSNQKFNNVRNLNEYFADIDTALKIMKSEGVEKILLSGHSTGGLIVSLYASENRGKEMFDAIFLNSPFFDMNLGKFLEKTVVPSVVKKGAKKPDKLMKGGLSKWYGWSLHRSEGGIWEYNLAWKPLVPPPVNYGWIKAIRDGQLKLQSGIAIGKPILVMHSDKSANTRKFTNDLFFADAVLDVNDIAEYSKKIQGNVTIKVIPMGMHDLVLSSILVRERVYTELFTWCKSKI